jgi:hypothetical protein
MVGYSAHNFELVGYHDLDGKPGFKLAMQVVDDHWYLYHGHFWEPLWTILDVTDPSKPRAAAQVPGPRGTWTLQVQVADGKLVTALEHPLPGWGGEPGVQPEEGIYVWDVSDPARPRRLSHWKTRGSGTHRNHYDGGRYVHLAAGMPGFDGNIYVIVDIEDPARPREVGRWFVPEQYVAGGARPTPPADGPSIPRISLHGPAYVEGDRAYLGYGGAGMVILDISDVSLPRLVSRLEFGPAFTNSLGMHTVIPLKRRNLAIVNTEAIAESSDEPLNFAGLVDISDERDPRLISLFPTPIPPPGGPYPNFQKRGGRFGPHNQHHPQHQPWLLDRDDLVYLTWFNAGLRVYDIHDPYLPREVGYFLPDDPTERRGPLPKTALVTQSEDVLVDARGYAYLTDKNHGLHIVRYIGELA